MAPIMPAGCRSLHEFLWSSMGYSLPWHTTHLCLKCPSHTAAGHGKSFKSSEIVGFTLSFSEGGFRDGERNLYHCIPLGGCVLLEHLPVPARWGVKGLWAFSSSPLQHPALLHCLLPDLILRLEGGGSLLTEISVLYVTWSSFAK